MNGFCSAVLLGLCLATLPQQVSAALRRVPSQYATIQAAINASSSGDSVAVAPGTYSGLGNIEIDFHGKAVVLFSEGGAAVTTIHGDVSVFRFYSGETPATLVSGFTVQGSFSSAVSCISSSPTIVDCVFRENGDYGAGGAMSFSDSAAPTIIGCQFSENREWGPGGAIAASNSSLTIKDCSFTHNWSVPFGQPGQGGALFITGGSITLRGCTFSDNVAVGPTTDLGGEMGVGGGLSLQGTNGSVTDCVFSGNRAISEDGMWVAPEVLSKDPE